MRKAHIPFFVYLTPTEREALRRLAQHGRLTDSEVVRRLIISEASRMGLVVPVPTPSGAESTHNDNA